MVVFIILRVISFLVCISGGLILAVGFCNLLDSIFSGNPFEINIGIFITGVVMFVIGGIGTVCIKPKKVKKICT